jgi:UrcA family protein
MLQRASIVLPENISIGHLTRRSIFMRIRTAALFLVTGSIGLAFAGSASAASCGTYGGYDPGPAESVTVTAPRMERVPSGPYTLNLPPERVALRQPVQFADLNLCTSAGAEALRERVRAASNNVCDQLSATYPHGLPSDTSCYHDAMDNAQPKVDFVIDNTRGLR